MQNRPKIALVSPSKVPSRKEADVAAALEARGFDAEILSDGSLAIGGKDILVLYGSLGRLRGTARLLRKMDTRPVVIGWHHEALPPTSMSTWARKWGLRLTPATLGLYRSKPLLHILAAPVFWAIARFGLGQHSSKGSEAVQFQGVRMQFESLAFVVDGLESGWMDSVGMSTLQKCDTMSAMGHAADFLPVGQQPHFGEDQGKQRNIDVLFVGNLSRGRLRQGRLKAIAKRLENNGLNVEIHKGGYFGDRRIDGLNRTKIMLHVHQFPWDTPWMRWLRASACGAAMASEPMLRADPLSPGAHFLSAPLDSLADEIIALVADEPRRLAMVRDCRARIDETMTLKISVDRLVEMIQNQLSDRAK